MVAEATLGCSGCTGRARHAQEQAGCVGSSVSDFTAFIKGWALPLPSAGPTPD